jgi:hypothetical protein
MYGYGKIELCICKRNMTRKECSSSKGISNFRFNDISVGNLFAKSKLLIHKLQTTHSNWSFLVCWNAFHLSLAFQIPVAKKWAPNILAVLLTQHSCKKKGVLVGRTKYSPISYPVVRVPNSHSRRPSFQTNVDYPLSHSVSNKRPSWPWRTI